MKFKKLRAEFTSRDIDLAEELICHVFFSFNLKGVVCDIPIPEPDEGFGTDTLQPPEQNAIIGYLPDIDSSELIISQIKEKLAALADAGIEITPTIEIVDEKDWADAWKDYFNVTRITDRIVVKPEWKPYESSPGEIVIHIDPGMAFGTGTHPTTAMCLELIDETLRPGQTVLDVGCGSGILMIAAAGLDAATLTGIDTDPVAVDITRENLDKNAVPADRYTLVATTLDQIPAEPYDMVVANIIAQVIVDISGDIRKRMARNGLAILSGIIQERLPDVLEALAANELEVLEEKTTGEWKALLVARKDRD
ncbi:MAG: 50S ribosomal protein L11 methyltransferase [Desulfobacterales bacterium]|nr:50S ribosomal protein L11 methyltransferase [Desulfobacterales bacterium]